MKTEKVKKLLSEFEKNGAKTRSGEEILNIEAGTDRSTKYYPLLVSIRDLQYCVTDNGLFLKNAEHEGDVIINEEISDEEKARNLLKNTNWDHVPGDKLIEIRDTLLC